MLLVDQEIQIFLRNGTLPDQGQTAIYNGVPECVTNIGYDLRAKSFLPGLDTRKILANCSLASPCLLHRRKLSSLIITRWVS